MAKMSIRLSPQCKMMNVCGIDIIGDPVSGTIIGLDSEGMALVKKIQSHEEIDGIRGFFKGKT